MSQFLLMYLTGTRLAVLISALVITEIAVLVTVFVFATPTSVDKVLATKCVENNNSNTWLYPRGKGRCNTSLTETSEVVFAFQLPMSINNSDVVYSRWQQYLLGVLQLDKSYKPAVSAIDARLAYRNKEDPDDAWHLYSFSAKERVLDQDIPLFALGSLNHDYYLLNIRFPENKFNQIQDLWLLAATQNSGYTKAWFSLKTMFFPFILNCMVNFKNAKHRVPRPHTFLEYQLLFLGAALTLFNIPLEYITLLLPVTFMSLLNDIRQGIFYTVLLYFWLVFTGELLKIQDNTISQTTFRCYWKHASAVAIGCLSMFIFDICEHGFQLYNPFYSIKTNVALLFNIVAGIAATIYFFFLCYRIWKLFCNLNMKLAVHSNISVGYLLIYKRFINRLKFLMLATLLCAGMMFTEFIVSRASERNGDLQLGQTSAFFVIVYSVFNIYTGVVIIFCIPIGPMLVTSVRTLESENSQVTHSEIHTDMSVTNSSQLNIQSSS